MIEQVYIKNFKACEDSSIRLDKNNLIIGENDSGKTTILEALEIFFNQEKMEKNLVRNPGEPVIISVLINKVLYEREYSGAAYKLTHESDNIKEIEKLRYIYIPVSSYNVDAKIKELAKAKVLENTPIELVEDLKKVVTSSIEEIIDNIDKELIVMNGVQTTIIGTEKFKYDKGIDFDINSEGIPLEGRGSGYQKNLMYALLVGSNYSNVILGIDEIENSFSINNSHNIIKELTLRMGQTIFTTHSRTITELYGSMNANVIPLYSKYNTSLIELLDSLDNTNNKKYLIVEGKTDLPWYRKCINLLGKTDEYVILPGGGESNIDLFLREMERYGKKCIYIKDGDTDDEYSLSKDIIEMYTPIDEINRIFSIQISVIPDTKEEFMECIKDNSLEPIADKRIKSILASECEDFLKEDNPLVEEVKVLLDKFEN